MRTKSSPCSRLLTGCGHLPITVNTRTSTRVCMLYERPCSTYCGTASRTTFSQRTRQIMSQCFGLCKKSATNLVALYAVTSKQMRGRQLATDHSCKLLCCGKPNSATRTIRGRISNHAAPEKATHSVNIQIQIDIRAFGRFVYHSNKDELTNSHEECRGATSSPPIPGSHSPLSSWDSRYTKLRRTLIMTKVPNPPLSRSVSAWPMSACGSVDLA